MPRVIPKNALRSKAPSAKKEPCATCAKIRAAAVALLKSIARGR